MSDISKKITKFCRLYGEYIINILKYNKKNLSKELIEEVENLQKDLIQHFFYSPGTLIEFDSKKDRDFAKKFLDLIWNYFMETSDLYQILIEESFIFNELENEIIARLQDIKPTMLVLNNINYPSNFKKYYNEAMRAWLFGLNNAAIILCSSLLEETLETILSKFSLDYENEKFEILINHAKTLNVIDEETHNKLHQIRRIRNQSIHGLEDFSWKTSLEIINSTKEIIEKLYSL